MNNLQEQLQPIKDKSNQYTKEHKTFDEQLTLLKSRGLVISNDSYALTKLQHINYYRLSAYFPPFQHRQDSKDKDRFLEGYTIPYLIDNKNNAIKLREYTARGCDFSRMSATEVAAPKVLNLMALYPPYGIRHV